MSGAAPDERHLPLTAAEARATLRALSWLLTRRPDALLDEEGRTLLAVQGKLTSLLRSSA